MKAHEFLQAGAEALQDRAATRDKNEERSMAKTVAIFNAATGRELSESEGWLFMVALKIARHTNGGKVNPDDFTDGAAYFALLGECETSEVENSKKVTQEAGWLEVESFEGFGERGYQFQNLIKLKDGSWVISTSPPFEPFAGNDRKFIERTRIQDNRFFESAVQCKQFLHQ